jgi:hypothetical protein
MNNVLDYQGYRFFQSSFDPDEKGPYCPVNHDFWGTAITCWIFFMMSIMFTKHSRFADKTKTRSSDTKNQTDHRFVSLLLSFNGFAQTHNHEHDAAGIMRTIEINHASSPTKNK